MPVSLRTIDSSDRELLLAIYRSTREEELALTDWTEEQKTAFVRHQFEAQSAEYTRAYPNGEFSLILVDGQPAGRLYLTEMSDQLRIIDIALLPEFRAGGIGGGIISDVIARAEARGLSVTIHVERFNPAMHLYQRLGFREIQDRGVYVLMERPPNVAKTE
jgi:GNAT superfamily N-acetyltransferase